MSARVMQVMAIVDELLALVEGTAEGAGQRSGKVSWSRLRKLGKKESSSEVIMVKPGILEIAVGQKIIAISQPIRPFSFSPDEVCHLT